MSNKANANTNSVDDMNLNIETMLQNLNDASFEPYYAVCRTYNSRKERRERSLMFTKGKS